MKEAPIPKNEKKRLESLKSLKISRISRDHLDRITEIATKLFGVPISTVTFVDSNKEKHFSVCGLKKKEGSRAASFCGHAVAGKEDFVIIPDAKKDKRFRDNPMVKKGLKIRFYAAIVLKGPGEYNIGTLCIKDKVPRKLSKSQIDLLKNLGAWAQMEINFPEVLLVSKKLEESKQKIQEVNKKLKEFNSLAAHELKVPIMAVISRGRGILENELEKLSPKLKKEISFMLNNAERANKTISQIMALSKSEIKGNLVLVEVEINSHIEKIIEYQMKDIAKEKNISIRLRLNKIPKVKIDEDRFIELIDNLVMNAIKYTSEGGSIVIKTSSKKGSVLVEVKDTGIGISKKDIPKLFRKFSVINKSEKSTGLGLATSKEIVESHKGKIGVKSSLGRGSTFWFTLPLRNKNEDKN